MTGRWSSVKCSFVLCLKHLQELLAYKICNSAGIGTEMVSH